MKAPGRAAAALVALAFVATACGGGGESQPAPAGGGAPAADRSGVSLDKNAYPVFPDADAGADPAVSAEQGGKGFTGEGWQTNTDYDLIGDPRAVKGGVIREHMLDFPGTLRVYGPEANTSLNYMIQSMVYESLLGLHPTTYEAIPSLATHWQISEDKLSYRFRINPNARWADGKPVVAEDVVATWSFMMDKGLQQPSLPLTFGKFQKPVAETKYLVSVKSTALNWRNFLYFSQGMPIFPAHLLAGLDGASYLKEYNFKLLPGSGPYRVDDADVVKGKSVSLRRRTDHWAEKHRRNVGTANFDELREIVVRDEKLAFEMFKKGDLDYYVVNVSREWVEELNFDRVQRGQILKRKVFNDQPIGVQGFAFNTRKPPYDDIRLRQAMAYLMNRDLLIEKLFFKEYVPNNSYYFGGIYENPNNPKMQYDPQKALALLAEAGWKDHDAQGRLVKNGQPLAVELLYAGKSAEPYLTIYQEDLRKVGVALNLRLVTPETLWQLVGQRKFDLVSMAWGAIPFPNPETSYHSKLADPNSTNNITGMKDKRLDEIFAAYDLEFDQQKRVAMIREADGILANHHHYVLAWAAPFVRVAYWNKFGTPEGVLTRTGDYADIPSLWWRDAGKEEQLTKSMTDGSLKLDPGQVEVNYWREFAKRQPAASPK